MLGVRLSHISGFSESLDKPTLCLRCWRPWEVRGFCHICQPCVVLLLPEVHDVFQCLFHHGFEHLRLVLPFRVVVSYFRGKGTPLIAFPLVGRAIMTKRVFLPLMCLGGGLVPAAPFSPTEIF